MNIITRREFLEMNTAGLCMALGGLDAGTIPNANAVEHYVYARLMHPREHPDYARRHVRPPGWDVFGNRTHFATLRMLAEKNTQISDCRGGQIIDYVDLIDKFTRRFELGDVLWLAAPILFATNIEGLLDEIRRRNLFLFDVWGYQPGFGADGFCESSPVPYDVYRLLERKLGDHFLGIDNGETDGHYIGEYVSQKYPASAGRVEQYLNFQHHFELFGDLAGNKLSTLVSLGFGHYFLKEGIYTLIGAETAQALPDAQVFYAFIRGAGKQYGVPWFGNASIWNRWGWKSYGYTGATNGPTKGTSLSLLKRLMYSQCLYNCMFVSLESGWLSGGPDYQAYTGPPTGEVPGETGNTLSPIGLIQRAAKRWIDEVGEPGPMLTPVALMLDFYAGWTVPRHLYSHDVYRVWGNLPYGAGDYLTDGILDMLLPGYQNSGYFHDESGFLSPTPYGELADCILSDAEAWLLRRYSMVVAAGELEGGAEIHHKLKSYVQEGGRLVITAGNLAKFPEGLADIRVVGPLRQFPSGQVFRVGTSTLSEDSPCDLFSLTFPAHAQVLASCGNAPAVVEASFGKGTITVFASPFGLSSSPATGGLITSEVDKPFPKPYPLLKHVQTVLDQIFRGQMLFEAGEGLSLITCRKRAGEYTLAICNNTWREQPLRIVSHCGQIESIQESPLDQSEKTAAGYLPEVVSKANVGKSSATAIAGGDIRIFAVRVLEDHVHDIPYVAPPHRPRGRLLPLRRAQSVKEEVLTRPDFFAHFDGVVVDWKYLRRRERDALEREAGWIGRQKLRVFVDLTSGLNVYPDLRLVNDFESFYSASMASIDDVLAKMPILRAQDLILSLHLTPVDNPPLSQERAWASFKTTCQLLCEGANARQIRMHLRMAPPKPPKDLREAVEFLTKVDKPNLWLAPSTAFLLAQDTESKDVLSSLQGRVGLWLVSTPRLDIAGHLWDVNAPIAGYDRLDALSRLLSVASEAPLVLDVEYKNKDEEFLDILALERLAARARGSDPGP